MSSYDGTEVEDWEAFEAKMREKVESAERLLPAWFVSRMMNDSWHFGLLLVTGKILCIQSIMDVRRGEDGSTWIDAVMLQPGWSGPGYVDHAGPRLEAPTSRLDVSINAAHVVAAFEMADT